MKMGKVKLIYLILSIVSMVLGALLIIVSTAMFITVADDFDQPGSADYCDVDSFPTFKASKTTKRGYTLQACPGVYDNPKPANIPCTCKKGRFAASAMLLIAGVVQIGGGLALLFIILHKPQMPWRKKWMILLIVHAVVLVIVLLTAIVASAFGMYDDRADVIASVTKESIYEAASWALSNSHDSNPPGKAFAAFAAIDIFFCIGCIVVFVLSRFLKFFKEEEQAQGQDPGTGEAEAPPPPAEPSKESKAASKAPSKTSAATAKATASKTTASGDTKG